MPLSLTSLTTCKSLVIYHPAKPIILTGRLQYTQSLSNNIGITEFDVT